MVVHFEPEVLQRIVLEFGEAIMHIQYIYNTYLKILRGKLILN